MSLLVGLKSNLVMLGLDQSGKVVVCVNILYCEMVPE